MWNSRGNTGKFNDDYVLVIDKLRVVGGMKRPQREVRHLFSITQATTSSLKYPLAPFVLHKDSPSLVTLKDVSVHTRLN